MQAGVGLDIEAFRTATTRVRTTSETHALHSGTHAAPQAVLARWVTTTNHKDIRTLYLCFSLTMFFVVGLFAMGIRAELFEPGLQFWRPGFFNDLTAPHAHLTSPPAASTLAAHAFDRT